MLPKKRIMVSEGVFNVLAEKKDYLEGWDECLLRLANSEGRKNDNT